ncbi:MAG: methyltransferase domain-containing protein [Nitrospirota bacterium]|nr:methyltransferase domain-containing protein [Nitrospirota bacterium]
MTQQSSEQIIEAQRQDWNRVAGGWEKWDRFFDENMTFLNHRLVADARLRTGQHVLDLGSGTGYPALLAAQAVGPQGSVIGIDLAEAMLTAAGRKAKTLGLTNVTFRTGDVTTLPFGAGSFDAVISRFCLMFLPEIPKALGEITRVLKPGGYLAAAVWASPDKNPYLRISIDVIKQLIELPSPDPEAPGIFRLAKPGDLPAIAQQAGLLPLADEEVTAEVVFLSARDYYTSLMDLAAPIQNLLATLSASQKSEAEHRIIQAAGSYQRGAGIALPMTVRFVTARKPI